MTNFKFMKVTLLLQTIAVCTATITFEFERSPGNRANGQNGGGQQQAVGASAVFPQSSSSGQNQFSASNQQPITSASSSSSSISTPSYITPSIYNPPNSPFSSSYSSSPNPYQNQQQNPQQYQQNSQQYQPNQQYQQNPQQQQQQFQYRPNNNNNNNNYYQPQASPSGQHPFASYNHPNSIPNGDPNKPGRPNHGPGNFVSLLLGSMGLHGLSNGIFGRNGPRPNRPPKNGGPQQFRQNQNQQQQQPQQSQQSQQFGHFNNHFSAIQGVSRQQHFQQVQAQSSPYTSIPVQSPSSSGHQQTQQTAYSTQVESTKPNDYLSVVSGPITSSTQSYYETIPQQQSGHSHHQPQVTQTVQAYTQSGPGSTSYIDQGSSSSSHYNDGGQEESIKPYTIIEKPVVHYVEKPVIRFIEKTVVRTVEKPVIKYIEKPPRRGGLSSKDGEPYAAESNNGENTVGAPAQQQNEEIEVIHHNYPPKVTTLHHEEPSEYYSAGYGGSYYRNPNENPKDEQNQVNPNQGHQNQGNQNQGHQNQGNQNQGNQNQGNHNQGNHNQGNHNQGNQNYNGGKSRRSGSGAFEEITAENTNSFRTVPFEMPKELPAYGSPNYKLIKTHSFGPAVSGEGLEMSVSRRSGEEILESEVSEEKRQSKNRKRKHQTERKSSSRSSNSSRRHSEKTRNSEQARNDDREHFVE